MHTRKTEKRAGWFAALVAAVLVAWFVLQSVERPANGPSSPATQDAIAVGSAAEAGEAQILEAFAGGRSGLMVESRGVVERTLPDDNEGDRHQRFILRLASGHTLLMSHNIDLAARAPLAPGDSVEFRGQYEWNDKGGVIHWTHHDPAGRRPGGWIRHLGVTYR